MNHRPELVQRGDTMENSDHAELYEAVRA